jgi:hypothetical protein
MSSVLLKKPSVKIPRASEEENARSFGVLLRVYNVEMLLLLHAWGSFFFLLAVCAVLFLSAVFRVRRVTHAATRLSVRLPRVLRICDRHATPPTSNLARSLSLSLSLSLHGRLNHPTGLCLPLPPFAIIQGNADCFLTRSFEVRTGTEEEDGERPLSVSTHKSALTRPACTSSCVRSSSPSSGTRRHSSARPCSASRPGSTRPCTRGNAAQRHDARATPCRTYMTINPQLQSAHTAQHSIDP